MKPQIRKYNLTDLFELLSVWEKASEIAHPFLSAEFLNKERENIPNIYIPSADTWVAEYEGRLVGFLSLIDNEVGGLFTDPEFHGRGVGFALMNKASALHNTLEVEVFKDNTLGLGFYVRYGFKQLFEYTHNETGRTMIRLKYN